MRKLALFAVLLLAANGFAAGRELAPRPLIPQRGFIWNLSTASAGGRFLTVWREWAGDTWAIYGVLSDASGRRISPAAFLLFETPSADRNAIQLVGTGDSFALFWVDRANVVHLTDIDRDGRVLGTRATPLTSNDRLTVAWNGERFLTVRFLTSGSPMGVWADLLARDGTIVRAGIPLGADRFSTATHIAVTDRGFILFTGNARSFFAHVISGDGAVTQLVAGDPATGIAAATLEDGTLLVVSSTPGGQLQAHVWKDGAKLREQTLPVERGLVPFYLMRGDGRHLLAFVKNVSGRNQMFAMQLTDDGTPASDRVLAGETGALPPPAASNGGVLFVAHESGPTIPVSLVGSVSLEKDATIRATETLSIAPAAQSHVLAGAGGGSMLAAWNEATSEGTRIRTAVIGRDFEPENVRELAPEGVLRAPTLAWNGTEYLVVYQTADNTVRAARVAYDGTPIGAPAVLEVAPPYITAAVTWAGDRWAILWLSFFEDVLHYATVSSGGIASPVLELRPSEKIVLDVALAFDGRHVHLAWVEAPYPLFPGIPRGEAVFTTRLRRDGRIVDDTALAIPATHPDRVKIASNGERVILLVDDSTGTSVDVIAASSRELVSTRMLFTWPGISDLAWNGYEFVAALTWQGVRSYAGVWHLGADGSGTGAPRGTATAGWSSPSVASSPGYGAVLAKTDLDAASGSRAVIYAERELPRLPDPPRPPVNVRAREVGDNLLELTWGPPPDGGDVERYAVEERRNDGRIMPVFVEPDARVARTYDSNAMRVRTFTAGVPSPWTDWISPQSLPRRRAARP